VPTEPTGIDRSSRARGMLFSRPALLIAFAIEAALRALGGDLTLLLPKTALVVAVVALVITNYRQLVARFPEGGGAGRSPG
jgi:ABC-type arginine/histidine transport system permease subunit